MRLYGFWIAGLCCLSYQLSFAQPCNVQDTTVLPAGVCTGEYFVYEGDTLTAPGEYFYTFTGSDGCDSVVMVFIVGYHFSITQQSLCEGDSIYWGGAWRYASDFYADTIVSGGSCDSVAFLDLGIIPTVYATDTSRVCYGDSLLVNGQWYKHGDSYQLTFTASSGCDSVVTYLVVQYNAAPLVSFTAYVCIGDSFFFNGNWYQAPGTYQVLMTDVNGCDSAITLKIFVNPYLYDSTFAQICAGDSFFWRGTYFTSAGIYSDTVNNTGTCDSVLLLFLQVNPKYLIQDTFRICQGNYVLFNGQPIYAPGFYSHTYLSSGGCDSTRTLWLEVYPIYYNTWNVSICEGNGFSYAGNTYYDPGTYFFTFTSSLGCDSTIALVLTVLDTVPPTHLYATICSGQQVQFHGQSADTTGVYTAVLTAANGCDSLVILHLTVLPPPVHQLSASICQGDTFLFYGMPLTVSGTYDHLLTTAAGCDSIVRLTLTVHNVIIVNLQQPLCAGSSYLFYGTLLTQPGIYTHTIQTPGACDTFVMLHLIGIPSYQVTQNLSICRGQSINFFGNILTQPGTYTHTATVAGGCDSVVTLHLTVKDTFLTTVSANICQGSSYNFYGNNLSTPGIYHHKLSAANGCDSTIRLVLNVLPPTYTDIYDTICSNSSYNFFGTTLNVSGTYGYALVNTYGCDSIIRLHLTVRPASAPVQVSAQICSGSTYIFAGNTLTLPGTYTHTFQNTSGCDSTVTLHLTVADSIVINQQAFICLGDTFDFYGTPVWYSGIFTRYFTSSAGCDSIIRLNLGVLSGPVNAISQTICKGSTYNFYGQSLTMPGVYEKYFPLPGQCDSIVRLTLTVRDTSATFITANTCANQPYNFYGNLLLTSGIYTHVLQNSYGCDSTIRLQLIVKPVYENTVSVTITQSQTYTLPGGTTVNTPGTYRDTLTATNGCDSVIITHLTVLSATDEISLTPAAIIYPQPAADELFLKLPHANNSQVQPYITDLSGRTVLNTPTEYPSNHHTIYRFNTSHLPSGTYLLVTPYRAHRIAIIH
ncbi:MAG: T9SS type A sorting domain-containing protein [Chitinophagales bacterium]|nr:T9SS type A sorting domain-containing protein [Chitinophagales bacterium]MDW8420085.1 T9SS type A sorting domain-containing protein [Chitinophagales bacterium]